MKLKLIFLAIVIFVNAAQSRSVVPNKPIIIAHYMSWYQRPDYSGSWGFWQVNRPTIQKKYWHFPDTRKDSGLRDISSVYYPVIGPYDSADPDLCEYHILLAKLAGIDAFVADWYGPEPSEEHPYDNIGFTAMREASEELGFKVMICWEDRSMFPPVSDGIKTRNESLQRGVEMIRYLEKEWFSSEAYLKIDGRCVLTNFAWGSPGKTVDEPWLSAAEWDVILSAAKVRPMFIHDWHRHRVVNEFEKYDSVMPWGCTYHGMSDSAADYCERAGEALSQNERFAFLSGTVLPGFDNRGCGGWGTDGAIGITARRGGAKFRATWQDVIESNVKLIQVATWNDLNEGGTVEPVRSVILHSEFGVEGYGYRELETIAEYAGRLKSLTLDPNTLQLPSRIYSLRKIAKALKHKSPESYKNNIDMTKQINAARDYLLDGKAKMALDKIEDIFKRIPEDIEIDPDWLTGVGVTPDKKSQ